jgi:hypothetical protein
MATVLIRDPELYTDARTKLLEELSKVLIPKIQKGSMRYKGAREGKYISQRGDIIGKTKDGRTVNFGYGQIRHRGWGPFIHNRRFPAVYAALCDYADAMLPADFEYNTITLNQNILAQKHKDIVNVGESIILGIGDYEGGHLRVYSNDTDYVAHDIKDKPIKFNGHTTFHETEPFTGCRYTMIFYKQKASGLPRPSRILTPEAKAIEDAYDERVRAHAEAKALKAQAQVTSTS